MRYYLKVAIEHFAFGLVIPVSIIWKLNNGLSLSQAAATEAVVLVVAAIAEVPTGYFADKFGNKIALLAGAVFQSVALLLLAVGGSLPVFMISAVLSGIGWAFISGSDEAYLHDDYLKTPAKFKNVLANAMVADEAATVCGMLLGSLLLYAGIQMGNVFMLAGGLMLGVCFYIYFILPRGQNRPLWGLSNKSPSRGVGQALRLNLPKLLPIICVFAIIAESGRVLWQPHLRAIGINIASFGVIFSVLKIASILGSLYAKHKDFTTHRLAATLLLLVVSIVLFASQKAPISIAALFIFLFGENYLRVYMSTTLNALITSNRATTLSVASFTNNIVGGILLLSIGGVAQKSITIALLLVACLKIPAAAYILKYQRKLARG